MCELHTHSNPHYIWEHGMAFLLHYLHYTEAGIERLDIKSIFLYLFHIVVVCAFI